MDPAEWRHEGEYGPPLSAIPGIDTGRAANQLGAYVPGGMERPLAQRQFAWTQRSVTLRAVGQNRQLTEARAELPWLADLPAQSAQQVLRNLDAAYDNWRNPQLSAGSPKFKKRGTHLSVAFPGQSVAVRALNHRWGQVRLPKIGWIRFRLSRPFGGEIRNATVSRDALGWHVSFGVATHERPAVANGLPGCGVDFGVACSAFVSDESTPRRMSSTLSAGEWRRLRSLERRKARQLRWAKRHNAGRYSKRLRRSINEIAKLRARQARRRADFTHKFTTDVAKRHGWVGIEDLRVVAMTASASGSIEVPGRNVRRKATLNRAILDNAPGERRRQLAYKTHRDPASRPGCGRVFACTDCGYQAHADANAARNIEALAAGQAVNRTRSHPRVARPPSRMREPLGSVA
jgi:putative transposase